MEPLLIKELAELWLMDVKDILRPSSYARYQNCTSKYILPYIGEMDSYVFGKNDLSAMLGRLAGQENEAILSQHTVYIVESMVRAMFHYGADKKLIPEVAFGKAEYMVKNKKIAMPLSELETQQLIYEAEQQGTDTQIQVMLPLYAGVTLSELCGLKWEDINLEKGEIYIHRNLMRVQKDITDYGNEKPGTALVEFELPESECRKFVMPKKLNTLLIREVKKRNAINENYVASFYKKTNAQPDGRTLQNHLKALGKKTWIPELTFKRLRDTFAVMCLQAGGDVYSLAYVLGVGTNAVCERYKKWLVKTDNFLTKIS